MDVQDKINDNKSIFIYIYKIGGGVLLSDRKMVEIKHVTYINC